MAPTFSPFIVLLAVKICCAGAAGWDPGVSLSAWQQPQGAVIPSHGHAVLRCRPPPPSDNASWTWTVSWVKVADDGALRKIWREEGRRVTSPEGDLILHNVTRAADFRCLIQSPHGSILSRLTTLHIATLSRSVSGPSNLTVRMGATARLSCQVDSVPTATITWKKDNSLISKESPRFVTLPSGVLLISDVKAADEGAYRCMATNNVLKKSRHSAVAIFTVVDNTTSESQNKNVSFLSKTTNIQVIKGDTIDLECSTSSELNLTWSFWRDGRSMGEVNSSISLPGIRILSLQNIQEDQAGSYNCSFSSGSFSDYQVTEVDVVVPPTVVKPPQSQTYPTARTARFSCEVYGYPPANISWYKDGLRVDADGRTKIRDIPGGTELVLSTTVAGDTGLYQCVARNSGGESGGVGYLFVNSSGLQSPPSNLSCRKIGENFIWVQWDQPDRQSADKIQAYTIHYWPTDNKGKYEPNLTRNHSFNATGLEPFRNYTFYVRAYGSRQASENSEELVCQTKESVPEAAPTVTLKAVSLTKLLVSWSPLPGSVARGHITEYKVLWRPFNGSATRVKEVSGKVLSYNITELIPGMKYEVRVLAATSKGWPTVSEDKLPWVDIVMPRQSSVLSAPTLQLSLVNSTCINVTWVSSSSNSKLFIGWQVLYGKEGGAPQEPIFLLGNATYLLLSALEPQTLYEVQISGYTDKENGDSSSQKIRTLPIASSPDLLELEAPYGLEAEPVSSHSINLTWSSPPAHVNVAFYFIVVKVARASRSSGFSKTFTLNSSSTWIEIQNLHPNTVYELKVRLHDVNGRFSPYSDKMECRTFENAPGVVTDVHWELLNSSSVKVMWKEQGTSVSQFNVSLVPPDGSKSIQLLLDGSLSSTEVGGLIPDVPYNLLVCALTRGGVGPTSPAQTVLIRTAGFIGNSSGEQYASQSTDIPLMLCAIVLISIIVVLAITVLMWRRTCKSVHNGPSMSVQSNGNLTSGSEVLEMEIVRCQLPSQLVEPVIGSNFDYKDDNNSIPSRHLVHITENPQYLTPIPCKGGRQIRFSHERMDLCEPEETFNLLPSKAIPYHHTSASESDESCGEEESDERSNANCDPLNATQLTNIDLSFLNNNNKSNSGSSNNSSTGIIESSGSERSNILTKQQLLVTLSSVPLQHVGSKSAIEIPEVAIISPNG